MSAHHHYNYALRYRWLTPAYDAVVRLLLPERTVRLDVIAEAHIKAGQRVLDVGCGTGTLALMIKQAHPGAEVAGIDGDPGVLDIARRKADQAGVEIALDHAFADGLPYPDSSFDRVVSTFVMHHLPTQVKHKALAEMFRVLRPGGEAVIGDLGAPRGAWARLIKPLALRFEETRDNLEGRLPGLMAAAGFEAVTELRPYGFVLGSLAILTARKLE